MFRPCSMSMLAHVCRNVWKPIQGTAAASAAGFSTRENMFDAESAEPASDGST
jgi:hypothetical protein